jgi:hypothetical protein
MEDVAMVNVMKRPRFFVREVEGRWLFGRDGMPYTAYRSKEAAVQMAEVLMRYHRDAELVVEDEAA